MLLGQAAPVRAAQTWQVQVGMTDLQTLAVANQYGPMSITINVGDTVTWTMDPNGSPHTVTFAGGEPQPPFGDAPGQRPGEINIFPAPFAPAGPSGPNAQFNGRGRASSGFPMGPESATYSLTFTQSGAFTYYCEVHPGMEGTVHVLPQGAALAETPDQARGRGAAELAATIGRANSLAARVVTERAGNPGEAVNAVLAGYNGGNASVLRYLPDTLIVNQGDTVEWTLADMQEIHTVTFLSGQEPTDPTDVRPNPSGPPTVVLRADVAQPRGGSIYTGTGYVNSGVLGWISGDYAWAVKMDAPPGTYTYLCLIHPFMQGSITVQ